MLRSSTTLKTADVQGFRRSSCRGEDSNLCISGERNLRVGHPQRASLALPLAAVVFAVLLPWLTAYAVVLAVGLRFVSRQWGAA